jgi:hypothetical protein
MSKPAAICARCDEVMMLASELAHLFADAESVLRNLSADDIEIVKQLRVMFLGGESAARVRKALDRLVGRRSDA